MRIVPMKRDRYAKKNVPIVYQDELPAGGADALSVYKGVLVLWDEDQDARVLEFVDQVAEGDRTKLLAVQEHEANLYLLWRGEIPEQYTQSKMVELENDFWEIVESRSVGSGTIAGHHL